MAEQLTKDSDEKYRTPGKEPDPEAIIELMQYVSHIKAVLSCSKSKILTSEYIMMRVYYDFKDYIRQTTLGLYDHIKQ